ncbi:MAG: Ig-like domain-containing protein [Candidatus Kariarchaeaceae archaeon]|jgi:Tol biopolymer transport system component
MQNCKDSNKPTEPEDTISPTVTITSPKDSTIVSEIVDITCVSSNHEEIVKVELWVDYVSTEISDDTEPYSLEWNTTSYEDNSSHTITVVGYDENKNPTESESITLIVNNSNSLPKKINIVSATYTLTQVTIVWEKSNEPDFDQYQVFYSETEVGAKTSLAIKSDVMDTVLTFTDSNPTYENWFWVEIKDKYGYTTISDGYKLIIEPIVYNIAFASDRDGSWDIYMMDGDGGNLTNLTNIESGFIKPIEFSPDGSKILYTSAGNICTMNNDGSNQVVLTPGVAFQFSPDGSKILFTSNNNSNISIMNIDGSNPINLTNISGRCGYAQFSPDGSKILYHSTGNNYTEEIYSIGIDGENNIKLAQGSSPRMLPDGSKIVFTFGDVLYIMNVDGSNQTSLSDVIDLIEFLQIYPDGSKVLFTSGPADMNDIWIMNIDGSNQTNITNNLYEDLYPKFSPDGLKIAFCSLLEETEGAIGDIFIMDIDGNYLKNLTNNPARDEYPIFQP